MLKVTRPQGGRWDPNLYLSELELTLLAGDPGAQAWLQLCDLGQIQTLFSPVNRDSTAQPPSTGP